jgi:8-amino-7-oxononanoate synthase
MVNFARDYVYSTHMPPAQAHAISAAVACVKQADAERAHLQALIRQFKVGVAELGLVAGESSTAIQPLIIGDADKAVAVANKLRERGLWVTAIRRHFMLKPYKKDGIVINDEECDRRLVVSP